MMLSNNIIIEKLYDDADCIKARIMCVTTNIQISSEYYISNEQIKILCDTLNEFINVTSTHDAHWSSGVRGDDYTPCIEFTFIRASSRGRYLIEVFMELDDGGEPRKHTACFFLEAETNQLVRLWHKIQLVLDNGTGYVASFDE